MPFRQIPYATENSKFMSATSVEVKINMQTNQPATDRTTGEVLKTVSLLEMLNGSADVLKVTVPASQVPEDLELGTNVRPVGLVAIPWVQSRGNGQLSEGIAYRAAAIERCAPASAPTPAPASSAAKPSTPIQKTETTK
ncbi:hypothetical protein ACIQCG_26130 [Streptomyces noursei]|uniref:hypothetical protein n=1 Tax=Streptomyces noursei TaxID=1971 RepID=UPI00382F7E80